MNVTPPPHTHTRTHTHTQHLPAQAAVEAAADYVRAARGIAAAAADASAAAPHGRLPHAAAAGAGGRGGAAERAGTEPGLIAPWAARRRQLGGLPGGALLHLTAPEVQVRLVGACVA